jgi:hypothetical protein
MEVNLTHFVHDILTLERDESKPCEHKIKSSALQHKKIFKIHITILHNCLAITFSLHIKKLFLYVYKIHSTKIYIFYKKVEI